MLPPKYTASNVVVVSLISQAKRIESSQRIKQKKEKKQKVTANN